MVVKRAGKRGERLFRPRGDSPVVEPQAAHRRELDVPGGPWHIRDSEVRMETEADGDLSTFAGAQGGLDGEAGTVNRHAHLEAMLERKDLE